MSGESCRTLDFFAAIASPHQDVLERLSVGETLTVRSEKEGQSIRQFVLYTLTGERVGAITEHWDALLRCIPLGFEYQAEVVQLDPYARVRVQSAS